MKKRAKSKKAQVSYFMIFGIILIVGASMYFYFTKEDRSVKEQTSIDKNSINNYIRSCLRSSFEKNLLALGAQGGAIYISQNGLYPNFANDKEGKLFIKHQNTKIPYLIMPPVGSNDRFYSKAPDYPWKEFPYIVSGEESFIGYFGLSFLLPLYKINMANQQQPLYSIQGELEEAILHDVKQCDLSIFEEQYKIEQPEPQVNVLFKETTIVRLAYEITITDYATGAKTTLTNFTESVQLDFPGLYEFLSKLLTEEIHNVTHDISKETSSEFAVAVNKEVMGKDDLIIVTSKKSKVSGEPYKFQFARKNRIPALAKIDWEVEAGRPVTREMLGIRIFDPDEDDQFTINYKVNGAKLDEGAVLPSDVCDTKINPRPVLTVEVSDGELEDSQQISLLSFCAAS